MLKPSFVIDLEGRPYSRARGIALPLRHHTVVAVACAGVVEGMDDTEDLQVRWRPPVGVAAHIQ